MARGPTEKAEHKNTVGPGTGGSQRWMKISLGHSNNDLHARNAARQPQRGGV